VYENFGAEPLEKWSFGRLNMNSRNVVNIKYKCLQKCDVNGSGSGSRGTDFLFCYQEVNYRALIKH
jgi:hypothetical protein